MKLQHSTTQVIDDLQNCQPYNEKQVIYKINLRPWTLPGTRFFNAHSSVKLKEGEGSVFTSEGWAILDIMPGWEIVKGAKAVKPAQPAQPTQQEQPKENTQPAQQETTPAQEQEQQPAAAPQPKKEQAQPAPAAQGNNAFSAMLDFSNFAAAMEAKIKEAVLAELPKVQPAAQPETKRETITVKGGQQIGKVQGHTCRNFAAIVRTVAQSVPVYMYGPAGCGKSHTAKQVAESLGLDFYETSTVLFAHEMKGYGDANGHFVDTPFYKAFVNGGLFFLDEVDASAPDALVVLNTAIANGRFDFPVVGNKAVVASQLKINPSNKKKDMEPRIIKGKKYLCKKSVTIDGQKHFIKGKTYTGDGDQYYPDPDNIKPGDKHCCGFIINELGQSHAWPYIPAQHLWCSDCWTDYFTELN